MALKWFDNSPVESCVKNNESTESIDFKNINKNLNVFKNRLLNNIDLNKDNKEFHNLEYLKNINVFLNTYELFLLDQNKENLLELKQSLDILLKYIGHGAFSDKFDHDFGGKINNLTLLIFNIEFGFKSIESNLGVILKDIESLLVFLEYSYSIIGIDNKNKITAESFFTKLNKYIKNFGFKGSISFINNVDPDLLLIINSGEFIIYIQNMVKNSIKHGFATNIQIELNHEGDEFIFSIIDNGIGVDEDKFGDINDIFKKGKTSGNGDGLGLLDIKKSILKYGGNIIPTNKPGLGLQIDMIIKK